MARADRNETRSTPRRACAPLARAPAGCSSSRDRFGRFTEAHRPRDGHPVVPLRSCRSSSIAWMAYNTLAPEPLRFDSQALGFTVLTLILSLQASYAAPLILLAQNRQDDRDRVQIEQDRQRAERNLADTEYLAREVVALRLAMQGHGDARTSSAPSCARCSRSSTRRSDEEPEAGRPLSDRRRRARRAGPRHRPRDPPARSPSSTWSATSRSMAARRTSTCGSRSSAARPPTRSSGMSAPPSPASTGVETRSTSTSAS